MKKIIISLMVIPFISGAGTVEEAGGRLGDKTPIKNHTMVALSDESKKPQIKPISEKGGGSPIYYRYHAATGVDFDGRTSDFVAGGIGHGVRSCQASSTEQFIDHEIKIKNGEILQWFDVWGNDSNATENMTAILYRQCYPVLGSGPSGADFLLIEDIERNAGNFFYGKFMNLGFEDNEHECKLMARIRFGDFLNGDCDGSQDLQLYKVRAQILGNDLIFMDNMEDY